MSSLKDLARECGVSVATVSKALNGQHDISDATRARVREAAERLGYVPNMAARSMKTNRTYNLGVLFVDERQSGLGHEYFSAVLDSSIFAFSAASFSRCIAMRLLDRSTP